MSCKGAFSSSGPWDTEPQIEEEEKVVVAQGKRSRALCHSLPNAGLLIGPFDQPVNPPHSKDRV